VQCILERQTPSLLAQLEQQPDRLLAAPLDDRLLTSVELPAADAAHLDPAKKGQLAGKESAAALQLGQVGRRPEKAGTRVGGYQIEVVGKRNRLQAEGDRPPADRFHGRPAVARELAVNVEVGQAGEWGQEHL
jgi:ribonuclease R